MKILTYQVDDKERLGFLSSDGDWVYPVESAGMDYKAMQELIKGVSESELQMALHVSSLNPYESEIRGATPLANVRLLAPIPCPEQDIICLGVNYEDHAKESKDFLQGNYDAPPSAVYFGKRVNRASGCGDAVPSYPGLVEGLDYETELAVIIGKDARNVPPERARDYIFGYTILNDISARNLQNLHGQWYFGKSLDGFAPMGPWIVTADEMEFPPRLSIRTKVNGEIRQNGNTDNLIFGISHIISELSAGMTLRAGTIVSTGTPAGAGVGFQPPRYLRPGDEIECMVEKIGRLFNTVV